MAFFEFYLWSLDLVKGTKRILCKVIRVGPGGGGGGGTWGGGGPRGLFWPPKCWDFPPPEKIF